MMPQGGPVVDIQHALAMIYIPDTSRTYAEHDLSRTYADHDTVCNLQLTTSDIASVLRFG